MKKSQRISTAIAAMCAAAVMNAGQIKIETNGISMILESEPGHTLDLCYFGEKLMNTTEFAHAWHITQPDTGDAYGLQLYPAYGGRFFLNPALKLTHADGVITTELVYESHEQTVIDDNRTATVIRLRDKIYDAHVDLHFLAYNDENVITQSVVFRHNETGNVLVENIASSYITLKARNYYLTHFHGTWAREMQLSEERLTPGVKVIESKKGVRTTQSDNSAFLVSLDEPAQEYSGEIYAGALAWTGNYKMQFEVDEAGLLHIVGGINPFASAVSVAAGEEFATPEMILTYSNCGRSSISHNLHDWTRKYNIAHGNEERPIVLNSWEGAYFDFDEDVITGMIDDAAEFGIEMFVLDDGWFGNKYPRNADNAGLGDWQVNKKKLPHGISYLADYAVSKGLKFGIWMEPEMVNPDSELAHRHPEWIVQSGERDMLPMRNQLLLDLTNPEVQDFVFNAFDGVLNMSPNISYVKWDANRHADNVGSTYLAQNEQNRFWHDYINGLYSVYKRIRAKYPDITIQLCSSGGGRLDFGALKYHDEFWTSDNTNALDRLYIQYGTNIFFPAIATAAHVSTSPNHQTGMMLPLKFRFDVAMMGRLGMEMQPGQLEGAERTFAIEAIKLYKELRPTIQFGDLYRLNSPYDNDGYCSNMYVSKNRGEAVVFAFSTIYHNRTQSYGIKLQGLDPNRHYLLKEVNTMPGDKTYAGDGKVYSGEFLMKAGLSLPLGNAFSSMVFHLVEQ